MLSSWIKAAMAAAAFLSSQTAATASELHYRTVFADQYATGSSLVHAFFEVLSATGSPSGVIGTTREQDKISKDLVKPFLDPAFQVQRATGQRYAIGSYIPSDVDLFELEGIHVTRPSKDVLVVRYSAKTIATLPGEELVMSKTMAPRLTVFHWSSKESRWRVLSHANFNTPIAAICNDKPIVESPWSAGSDIGDQELGEQLMTNFFDLIEKGDARPMLHPLIQYQSANGVGYTTLAERQANSKFPRPYLDKPAVTRNGSLLVVTQYNTADERVLMGKYQLRGGKSSLIATFMTENRGPWRLIAFASFAPAKTLPVDFQCKDPALQISAPLQTVPAAR